MVLAVGLAVEVRVDCLTNNSTTQQVLQMLFGVWRKRDVYDGHLAFLFEGIAAPLMRQACAVARNLNNLAQDTNHVAEADKVI